jgi:phosphoribosylformylglycinamidine synthase subunit PurS
MAAMQFHALIEVRLREGIADPQGATIERSLPTLGFEGMSGVRVGKAIRLVVEADDEDSARSRVADVCARYLTNPVIEDATISLEPATDTVAAR